MSIPSQRRQKMGGGDAGRNAGLHHMVWLQQSHQRVQFERRSELCVKGAASSPVALPDRTFERNQVPGFVERLDDAPFRKFREERPKPVEIRAGAAIA